MAINKKVLTIAISTIISMTYASSVYATDFTGPIIGGQTTLNDGDRILYTDKSTVTSFVGVKLSSPFDSLIVNGAANININSGADTTGISAQNGSNLDLGSGSRISTTGLGTLVGLEIVDTSAIADNLTINSSGTNGRIHGLTLTKNAALNLSGDTRIIATNTSAGSAGGIYLNKSSVLNIDHLTLNVQNGDGYGAYVEGGSTLTLGDGAVISTTTGYGLFARDSGTVITVNGANISTTNGEAVVVQNNAHVDLGSGTLVYNSGSNNNNDGIWVLDSTLSADNLTVISTGNSIDDIEVGIDAQRNSTVIIGENSHVISSTNGVAAREGAQLDFKGSTTQRNTITSHSSYAASAQVRGILNIENTDIAIDNSLGSAKLYGIWGIANGVVNARNTFVTMNSEGSAIVAQNGGTVNLSGETTINSDSTSKSALVTKGDNATINVTDKAIINGNISASGNGSLINIDVNNNSVITGNAAIDTIDDPGATINLKATDSIWNVTGDSQVNQLSINDSTLNFTGSGFRTLSADELSGTGGHIELRTDIVANKSDRINIAGTAVGSYTVNITNSGSSRTNGSEQITIISSGDNQADFALTNKVELGAYEYDLRQVSGSPNDLELYSTNGRRSSTADAASGIAAVSYLTNYIENQTLLQRLGDLRSGQVAGQTNDGLWMKGFNGSLNSFSGSGVSGFDMDYWGVVTGVDKQITFQNSYLLLGGMAGFTRANPDYRRGDGHGKNYSAGLYATYMVDNGFYIDGLLKYNDMKNKFSVKDTANNIVKGTSKTQGVSISAELGKRFWLTTDNEGRYLEPQVQLTYSYQNGDTIRSSNGLNVGLSHYNSVLGRVGTILGYQTTGDSPINVYAKIGLVREMSGSINYRFNDGEKNSYNFRSGWVNGGLGANVNINRKHSLFAEADYSAGGSFNNRMFNAGYRYSF